MFPRADGFEIDPGLKTGPLKKIPVTADGYKVATLFNKRLIILVEVYQHLLAEVAAQR